MGGEASIGRSARLFLFKFLEKPAHRLAIKRREVLQFQRLHHVERPLLVFLEVGGLDVMLIGFLRSVDFEDSKLSAILLHLIWEEAEHTRLLREALLLDLCCSVEIFREILRIDLDFCYSAQSLTPSPSRGGEGSS